MIPPRLRSLVNSVLWVLGAVMMGGALNTSVVAGEAPLTAPGILLQLAVGAALVAVGYALRPRPDGLPGRSEPDEPAGDEEAAFDPELSPVGSGRDDERE